MKNQGWESSGIGFAIVGVGVRHETAASGYGGNDNRINATIPKATELMKQAGKTYEPVIYEGAGHGFMRAGEAPDANEPNKKARDQAWQRWKELLKKV